MAEQEEKDKGKCQEKGIVRKKLSGSSRRGNQAGQGRCITDICREKGIIESIYYRWKREYGGMHPSEARRLKELEKENNRLKKLVAEVMLDIQF